MQMLNLRNDAQHNYTQQKDLIMFIKKRNTQHNKTVIILSVAFFYGHDQMDINPKMSGLADFCSKLGLT